METYIVTCLSNTPYVNKPLYNSTAGCSLPIRLKTRTSLQLRTNYHNKYLLMMSNCKSNILSRKISEAQCILMITIVTPTAFKHFNIVCLNYSLLKVVSF